MYMIYNIPNWTTRVLSVSFRMTLTFITNGTTMKHRNGLKAKIVSC